MNSEFWKDIWENYIKKYLPQSTIAGLLICSFLSFGIFKIFQSYVSNDSISSEYRTIAFVGEIVLHLILWVGGIIYLLRQGRKKSQGMVPAVDKSTNQSNPAEPHGSQSRVNAYIVQSEDAQERDAKFVKINQSVRKTYWVFGTTLTSIASRQENMIKSMAKKGVEIRLCMMAPAVATQSVCQSSIQSKKCDLHSICCEYLASMERSDFEPRESKKKFQEFRRRFRKFEKNEGRAADYLAIYKALIDTGHIKEYFSTATDYSRKLQDSKRDILDIITEIQKHDKNSEVNLKTKRSFIPMSITIADAAEENGMLVVEFHVPFTSSKVLIEIQRQGHQELFQVFVRFFEKIWNESE